MLKLISCPFWVLGVTQVVGTKWSYLGGVPRHKKERKFICALYTALIDAVNAGLLGPTLCRA
jgi:hypothetical protein